MEELSYRHLYRVDRAHLGNFHLSTAAGYQDREDDLASNGLCGLAAFAAAVFKVIGRYSLELRLVHAILGPLRFQGFSKCRHEEKKQTR